VRIYTDADERRIHAQHEVRSWLRNRLIDDAQAARLEEDLRVDLVRTNIFMRIGLGAFTAVVVAAAVLLMIELLDLKGDGSIGLITGLSAVVAFIAAEALTRSYRLYRFGVEEGLAIGAVVLLGTSAALIASAAAVLRVDHQIALWLGAAACASFVVYRRFGLVYTALSAMTCAALVPFQLSVPDPVQRVAAAAVCGVVFLFVRPKRARLATEWLGEEFGYIEAAAWAGIYAALNMKLFPWIVVSAGAFYWLTYLTTLILPPLGLVISVKDRHRPMLNVSILMAIVSLATNKPYLGWTRYSWDPILLGLLLIGVAIGLRRWLARGVDGHRAGFTATPVAIEQRSLLTLLSAAPIPVTPRVDAPHATGGQFEGGRSGGGGASGSF
jgi:hypothetical protein